MPSSTRPHAVVEVINLSRRTSLGTRIRVAENAWSRAIGLLGETGLDPGGGLLIAPSSGIHTLGMRFPIDIVALDRQVRVRGLWPKLGTFRFAALRWSTASVLELPPGTIRASGTQIGDQLEVRESRPAGGERDTTRTSSNRSENQQRSGIACLIAALLIASACYALNYTILRPVVLRANPTVDFACYYRSARMVLAGDGARIYDVAAQHAYDGRLAKEIGRARESFDSRRFIAPPFVLLLYLPFAGLSLSRAEAAWYVLNVNLLFCLPLVLSRVWQRRWFLVTAMFAPALFLPILFTLTEGQNTILLLLLLAGSFVCFRHGMPLCAGALLGAASFKPHLVLPLLLALVLANEWKALAGFLGAAPALFAASVALVGWHATTSFPAVLLRFDRLPNGIGDSPWAMPNIRGLVYALLAFRLSPLALQATTLFLSLVLCVALVFCFRRCWRTAPELSFALAVVVAVLTSYHGYFHELSLLILPILLLIGIPCDKPVTTSRLVCLGLIPVIYAMPLVAPSLRVMVIGMVSALLVFAIAIAAEAWRMSHPPAPA